MKTLHQNKGLYIGRFQPFHLGHLSAIKQALEQVERLYIGIGSSQYHHTEENPFTTEEREKMIELTLKEAKIFDKCQIFLIPDIHAEEKWVEHVKKLIPPFDMVFVGNEGPVKTLFEKAGTKVQSVKQELDISATEVRKRIKSNQEWQRLVSPTTAEYLQTVGSMERIKKLG